MRASRRAIVLAAIAGAIGGAAVTALAYAGGPQLLVYLAAPGGLVDVVVNTPYHLSRMLAGAINALVYGVAAAVVTLAIQWFRGAALPRRAT